CPGKPQQPIDIARRLKFNCSSSGKQRDSTNVTPTPGTLTRGRSCQHAEQSAHIVKGPVGRVPCRAYPGSGGESTGGPRKGETEGDDRRRVRPGERRAGRRRHRRGPGRGPGATQELRDHGGRDPPRPGRRRAAPGVDSGPSGRGPRTVAIAPYESVHLR